MSKKRLAWWAGLIIAILTAIVSYCSCSVLAVTAGKGTKSSITQTTTTTTRVDSVSIAPR